MHELEDIIESLHEEKAILNDSTVKRNSANIFLNLNDNLLLGIVVIKLTNSINFILFFFFCF